LPGYEYLIAQLEEHEFHERLERQADELSDFEAGDSRLWADR
jgi:hypothetical protein